MTDNLCNAIPTGKYGGTILRMHIWSAITAEPILTKIGSVELMLVKEIWSLIWVAGHCMAGIRNCPQMDFH